MIPKIIHYCWFGRGPKPELTQKCIASWKKYLPDYQIKEWNEDNFDLDQYPYAKEAYENRKFAFAADVARLYALYTDGGIYMDTDVEVKQSLDPLLDNTAFVGYEDGKIISTALIASEKNGILIGSLLDYYKQRHFIGKDGSMDLRTNVYTVTNMLKKKGLKQDNMYQKIEGLVSIYPKDYFSPLSLNGRHLNITSNTYSIHHFMGSWSTKSSFSIFIESFKYNVLFKILPQSFINMVLKIKENRRRKHDSKNFG